MCICFLYNQLCSPAIYLWKRLHCHALNNAQHPLPRRRRQMQMRIWRFCAFENTFILQPLLKSFASLLVVVFFSCCRSFLLCACHPPDSLSAHTCTLQPICSMLSPAAYCSPPNNPENGTVHSLTGTKLGSTLRFSCDQGFRLIGQSSATCTRTAQGIHQWNAPVPLCQGE